MAYSSDIAKILTDQVAKFVTLNRHQLAGQAANLDFWIAEVQHCLDVIDGYKARFERIKDAQMNHIAENETVQFHLDDPCCTQHRATPPRRVSASDLGEARRSLRDATYRFLVRCFQERLIDETTLRRTCKHLDISVEAVDLRQRV